VIRKSPYERREKIIFAFVYLFFGLSFSLIGIFDANAQRGISWKILGLGNLVLAALQFSRAFYSKSLQELAEKGSHPELVEGSLTIPSKGAL